jgi:hypothetical protein
MASSYTFIRETTVRPRAAMVARILKLADPAHYTQWVQQYVPQAASDRQALIAYLQACFYGCAVQLTVNAQHQLVATSWRAGVRVVLPDHLLAIWLPQGIQPQTRYRDQQQQPQTTQPHSRTAA